MNNLYIIAGPNGAGKTTASYTLLPDLLDCKEFVNADEIAKGLSPFQADKVAIEAGRIMLKRINELLDQQVDFSFETTLSTRSYINTIKKAKKKNYQVTLIFFWLETPELAIERVKERVKEGGHNIPNDVIRRRFASGLKNLFELYLPVSDLWLIINNSTSPYQTIAEGSLSRTKSIFNNAIWKQLKIQSNGKQ